MQIYASMCRTNDKNKKMSKTANADFVYTLPWRYKVPKLSFFLLSNHVINHVTSMPYRTNDKNKKITINYNCQHY
jgi:hypothetical protein